MTRLSMLVSFVLVCLLASAAEADLQIENKLGDDEAPRVISPSAQPVSPSAKPVTPEESTVQSPAIQPCKPSAHHCQSRCRTIRRWGGCFSWRRCW